VELISILQTLWRRKYWVTFAVAVAASAGLATAYHVSLNPPSLKSKSFEVGAASTVVLFDTPQSALVVLSKEIRPLASRAQIFATFMRSPALTAGIARRAGIDPSRLTSEGPYLGPGDPNREVGAEKRATQLVAERGTYRLRFDSGQRDSPLPVVTIYAQAPSAAGAERLANAAAQALRAYVKRSAARTGAPEAVRLVVQQLTPAAGGLIAQNVAKKAIALTTFGVLFVLLLLIVVISGVTESWRREGQARATGGNGSSDNGSIDNGLMGRRLEPWPDDERSTHTTT
jgi:hypothetical protein